MARDKVLAALMAVILIVVAATVIVGITSPPPPLSESPPPSEAGANASSQEQPSAQPVIQEPQTAERSPAEPVITRIPVDGQDVADALQLAMWKFRFTLPEDQYTNYVWIERWTRDAQEPQIRQLGTGVHGVLTDGELVIKLPTSSDPRLFVRLGNSIYRQADAEPVGPPEPFRMDVLDEKQAAPADSDIHLITFTHNAFTPATGGLADVHRDHDVTIYLKTRFIRGPFVPFEEAIGPPDPDAVPQR